MPDESYSAPYSFERLTHGNYHSWVLRASGKLKKARVWRVVTGDDVKPPVPVEPAVNAEAGLHVAYARDRKALREWELNDEAASGILMELIAPDQERHIAGYTSSKDFWDRLEAVHKVVHAGIAAFYTKVNILKREYIEGESMQAHIDFLLGENKKLEASKEAFDDHFMAQVLLMSLPRPSLWDTIVVTLLQTVTDTHRLTTADVASRLIQEALRVSVPTSTSGDYTIVFDHRSPTFLDQPEHPT